MLWRHQDERSMNLISISKQLGGAADSLVPVLFFFLFKRYPHLTTGWRCKQGSQQGNKPERTRGISAILTVK